MLFVLMIQVCLACSVVDDTVYFVKVALGFTYGLIVNVRLSINWLYVICCNDSVSIYMLCDMFIILFNAVTMVVFSFKYHFCTIKCELISLNCILVFCDIQQLFLM